MSNIFDTAIKTFFSDPNLATAAVYVPLVGGSKTVSVITRTPDVFQNVGNSRIETPSILLDVQVSDCPALAQGDQFIMGAITYVVQGEPRRDSQHLTWQVDLYEN